jgi:hypothetical protein
MRGRKPKPIPNCDAQRLHLTGNLNQTRYLEGVTPADRILHANRHFDVKEIKVIDRRSGLEIRATGQGAYGP